MQSMTHSPGLHYTVRSLKQFDGQQLANLFKDTSWFEAFALTAEEAKAVMKQFAGTSSTYIKDSKESEPWG